MAKEDKKDIEVLWKKKYWKKVFDRIPPSKRLLINKHLEFEEFVIFFNYKPKQVVIRPDISVAKAIMKKMNDYTKKATKLSASNKSSAAADVMDILNEANSCQEELDKANEFIGKYLNDMNVFARVLVEEDLWPRDFEIEDKDPYEFFGNVDKTKKSGFVYFIKNEEIYKIGITDNLMRRMKELQADEMINTVKCVNYESLEKELHQEFKKYRIPQTEYFRLTPDLVKQVNKKMIEGAIF